MIDLCVINYKTPLAINKFFQTLKPGYDTSLCKLYIMDNHSEDDSLTVIGREMSSGLFEGGFSPSEFNFGYAYGANYLALQGEGNIIGILNADVWLTCKDVALIEDHMMRENIDILGPKQRDESGNITHGGIFGSNSQPTMRGWHESDPSDTKYRDVVDAVTVSGAAYFIKRDVWEFMTSHPDYLKVLEMLIEDEDIPRWRAPERIRGAFLPTAHYYEETWCSYFARHLGFRIVYDGRISIGHSWHASSPVGGAADMKFRESKYIFNKACDFLGIEHD